MSTTSRNWALVLGLRRRHPDRSDGVHFIDVVHWFMEVDHPAVADPAIGN